MRSMLLNITPTLVPVFVLLNMTQLHLITRKMVECKNKRKTRAEATPPPPSDNNGKRDWWRRTMQFLPSLGKLIARCSRMPPGFPGGLTYALFLFAATFCFFCLFFISLPMRDEGTIGVTFKGAILTFFAVDRMYYSPSLTNHLWLASSLFMAQAYLTYRCDCERERDRICCKTEESLSPWIETVTLVLGLASVLLSLSAPNLLG